MNPFPVIIGHFKDWKSLSSHFRYFSITNTIGMTDVALPTGSSKREVARERGRDAYKSMSLSEEWSDRHRHAHGKGVGGRCRLGRVVF